MCEVSESKHSTKKPESEPLNWFLLHLFQNTAFLKTFICLDFFAGEPEATPSYKTNQQSVAKAPQQSNLRLNSLND